MNKINLEYKSIYTNLNTFNNMYIGSYIPDYDQERGYKIQVVEDDYKTSLSNIAVIDNQFTL